MIKHGSDFAKNAHLIAYLLISLFPTLNIDKIAKSQNWDTLIFHFTIVTSLIFIAIKIKNP